MKKNHAGAISIILVLLFLARPAATQMAPRKDLIEREFLAWAGHSLHPLNSVAHPFATTGAELADLKPLRSMIGNATVVSFGEGVHGGAQPLEFRNLLFRYLVENLGFTAIAIESGITESDGVNQYVLGGPGDISKVVDQGFSWAFNTYPQETSLIQWMRDYNADPHHSRKIQFYGFDIPGSPTNPDARRGLRTGLEDALQYLNRVDPKAAVELRHRISSILSMLDFDPESDATNQYSEITQANRDRLTAAIGDMISLFERREAAYTAASASRDYQWAYRSAIGARQTDELLRQVPVGWTKKDGMGWLNDASAVRDRAMADNVHWILSQAGPDAKILIFAHRFHIATVSPSEPRSSGTDAFPSASLGTYLKQDYGKNLVTIGNLFSHDASDCKKNNPPAPTKSMEGMLSNLNAPLFMLDLRTAPAKVANWLKQPQDLYDGSKATLSDVGKAFDIVFFSRQITPAATCP